MEKLENIIDKIRIGIVTTTIALGNYGCATTPKVDLPAVSYVREGIGSQRSECMQWDKYGRECIYPIVRIEF